MEIARLRAIFTADVGDFDRKAAGVSARLQAMQGHFGQASTAAGRLAPAFLGSNAAVVALTGGMGGFALALGTAGHATLTYADQLNRLKIGFTTLTGSAQAANAHVDELKRFAARTPFEFVEVARASQRFQAMGVSASQVIPVLTAVGNAVAQVGGGSVEIDRVSRSIAQVQARGKVSAEEMNQLADALVDGWRPLEAELGKTRGELMKMAEQGQISADTFVRAFTKMYGQGDAMKRQMGTLAGASSTLKDNIRELSANMIDPLYQSLTQVTVGLANATDKTKTWGQSMREAFAGWATGAMILTNPQLWGNRGAAAGPVPEKAPDVNAYIQGVLKGGAAVEEFARTQEIRRVMKLAEAMGPAKNMVAGLREELRRIGDESTIGLVTVQLREMEKELNRLGSISGDALLSFEKYKTEALQIAGGIDAAKAAAEAARVAEAHKRAVERATETYRDFLAAQREALDPATEYDKAVRAVEVYSQAIGVARLNVTQLMEAWGKGRVVIADQNLLLLAQTEILAKINALAIQVNENLAAELPEVSGPNINLKLPEVPGPIVYDTDPLAPEHAGEIARRRLEAMQDVAYDLANIFTDVFDSIGEGWEGMWRSMQRTAQRLISDIFNDLIYSGLYRALTGQELPGNQRAGGLTGLLTGTLGGLFNRGPATTIDTARPTTAGEFETFFNPTKTAAPASPFKLVTEGATAAPFNPKGAQQQQASAPQIDLRVGIGDRQVREMLDDIGKSARAAQTRTLNAKRDRRRNLLRFA